MVEDLEEVDEEKEVATLCPHHPTLRVKSPQFGAASAVIDLESTSAEHGGQMSGGACGRCASALGCVDVRGRKACVGRAQVEACDSRNHKGSCVFSYASANRMLAGA